MTVIVVADVHGQTEAGYDGMLDALAAPLRRAEGSFFTASPLWQLL
jgi:hypothetical protein